MADVEKIIELVGFPGSGKTYMLSSLELNNFKVVTADNFYHHSKLMPRVRKNIDTIKYLICNFPLVFSLFKYALMCCRPIGYSLKRALEIVRYCVIYDYVTALVYKGEKIILDQGILQYLWSLSFRNDKRGIKDSRFFKALIKKLCEKYDVIYVYYKVDYNLAAKRASVRNSDCPIDKMPREEITRLYKAHKEDYVLLMKYLLEGKGYIVESYEELERIISNKEL